MTEEEKPSFRVRDLRGQEKEEKKDEPKPSPPAPEETHAHEGPITFSTFVLSMCTSTLIHLGLVENPTTKKKEKNLPLAKEEIDIIGMLAEKTKGNLDKNEQQLMDQALYDLRVAFVQASKKP